MRIRRIRKYFFYVITTVLCITFLNNNLKIRAGYNLEVQSNYRKKSDSPKINSNNIWGNEITRISNDISDFLVVKVFGKGDPGSGILIAQKDHFYYLITAKHVVDEIVVGGSLEIETFDRKKHNAKILANSKNLDASLIRFKSKNLYYPAFIDSSIFAYKDLRVDLIGYALPSKAVNQISLRKTIGRVVSLVENNFDGYEILYSNASNIGMSGGGLFTYPQDIDSWEGEDKCNGKVYSLPILIAMHGRGEEYFAGGKSGVNLGIPVHLILDQFSKNLLNEGITSLSSASKSKIMKSLCDG